MLSFEEIKNQFDKPLNGITAFRAMVKEYLQCKTLELIFQGPYKNQLVFIGGTKLRLFNNFQRFSEDLAFDFRDEYSDKDHHDMCNNVVKQFEKQNIKAEIDIGRNTNTKSVYTRYLLFPGILEKIGLTDHPKRKFFIKIDTQKHEFGSFSYQPEVKFLNRFDVFTPIPVAPDDVILATKLCSILERSKGRDYWDIVELTKNEKPNMDYIRQRLEYGKMKTTFDSPLTYIDLLKKALVQVDWQNKRKEIEKFIFDPKDAKKVEFFESYASDERVKSWLNE